MEFPSGYASLLASLQATFRSISGQNSSIVQTDAWLSDINGLYTGAGKAQESKTFKFGYIKWKLYFIYGLFHWISRR